MTTLQTGADANAGAAAPLRARSGSGAEQGKRTRWTGFIKLAFLIVTLLCLAALFQYLTGAYRSEFGGYPDEGSHFISGLMIRDYVARGVPTSPMTFALDYYRHYPRVSLGHWPPFYYFIEAAWFLLFPVTRTWALLLIATCSAVAGAVLIRWLSRPLGLTVAAMVAVCWLALPIVQENTSLVMIEMFFAAITFIACSQCARYLERPSLRSAALLGVLMLLVIMTKGNGWLVVPLYLLGLILAGRRIFGWQSVLIGAIVALALPFQFMTLDTVQTALPGEFGLASVFGSLRGFLAEIPELCGWPLTLLAAGQLAYMAFTAIRERRYLSPTDAVMTALLASMLLFHSVVNAGVEPRKVIVGLPAILYFAAAGALNLLARAQLSARPWSRAGFATAIIVTAVLFSPIGRIPKKPQLGLISAGIPSDQNANVLISGSGSFEGAAVCEIAMLDRNRPQRYVLRASKLLADTDWNSRKYRLKVAPAGLDQFLAQLPVSFIAVENRGPNRPMLHHELLLDALERPGGNWEAVTKTRGDGAPGTTLYRRIGPVPAGAWQRAWDQSPGSHF
jgi:hypothetical protein